MSETSPNNWTFSPWKYIIYSLPIAISTKKVHTLKMPVAFPGLSFRGLPHILTIYLSVCCFHYSLAVRLGYLLVSLVTQWEVFFVYRLLYRLLISILNVVAQTFPRAFPSFGTQVNLFEALSPFVARNISWKDKNALFFLTCSLAHWKPRLVLSPWPRLMSIKAEYQSKSKGSAVENWPYQYHQIGHLNSQ